jgi:hypothetical protein
MAAVTALAGTAAVAPVAAVAAGVHQEHAAEEAAVEHGRR